MSTDGKKFRIERVGIKKKLVEGGYNSSLWESLHRLIVVYNFLVTYYLEEVVLSD